MRLPMATTIDDLIREAYRSLNIIGERGSLTYEQLTQGLRFVNRLLDAWNTRFGLPPTISQDSFSTVAGQQSYTIGSGGNVNTTRPQRIINATITDGDLTYSVDQINYHEWMNIYDKTDTSDVPSKFYYDPNVPLGIIYLWPKPSKIVTFNYSQERNYSAYSLGDSVNFTPGIERALVCNLAKELLSMYPSDAIGALIIQNAKESLDDLKKYHIKLHQRDVGTLFDRHQDRSIYYVG